LRIREDSWSPRESQVRCLLVDAGLPEPEPNVDVFDDHGRFIGCVDLAHPALRAAEHPGAPDPPRRRRSGEMIAVRGAQSARRTADP